MANTKLQTLRDEAAGIEKGSTQEDVEVIDGPGRYSPGPNSIPIALSPKDRAGVYIIAAVGVITFVTMLLLIVEWWLHMPSPPLVPAPNLLVSKDAVDTYKAAVEAYRDASDATTAQTTAMFDALIARTLLPIATAILSYLFVQHAKDSKSNSD